MRLAEFIVKNIEPILLEWEGFARSLLPGMNMTVLELRDDAASILEFTARDMLEDQSFRQQTSKSRGYGGAGGTASEGLDDASARHGTERVGSGFNIAEVIAEYRALRASVLRLWAQSLPSSDENDLTDITRFNESLDQSLAAAINSYNQRVDDSRKMFLAILIHDLRNPISCIRVATQFLSKDAPDSNQWQIAINTNTDTVMRLMSDLIDYTSSELGLDMPLQRRPVNLNELCSEVIGAYQITHPKRTLLFHSDCDITGNLDPGRIRQVLCNLINNALQHGSQQRPVDVSVTLEGASPEESTIVLSIHNEGPPIPPDALRTIFEPLKRYATPNEATNRTAGSIGLGLYIVNEIVVAEGGTVDIVSTEPEGTTVTVRIPRFVPAAQVPRSLRRGRNEET